MRQPDRITNAFTALREQMLSLAERITGNRDDAADAVQDAFVKLWQQRDRYDSARHAQGAGMMTVRTTSIDMARRNSHRADVPIDQAADTPEEAEPVEAEPEIVEDNLPAKDYGGFAFNIYTRSNTTHYAFLTEERG